MIHTLKPIVCLGVMLSTTGAYSLAQTSDASTVAPQTTSVSPAAWVYIASTPKNSNTSEIVAYTAAANGRLTAMGGSPFRENVQGMAVNGKYLMGVAKTGSDINTNLIESDGALTYKASVNYAKYNDPGYDCGSAGQIFFDHTGATLYVTDGDLSAGTPAGVAPHSSIREKLAPSATVLVL
jgi:hypothetical protein